MSSFPPRLHFFHPNPMQTKHTIGHEPAGHTAGFHANQEPEAAPGAAVPLNQHSRNFRNTNVNMKPTVNPSVHQQAESISPETSRNTLEPAWRRAATTPLATPILTVCASTLCFPFGREWESADNCRSAVHACFGRIGDAAAYLTVKNSQLHVTLKLAQELARWRGGFPGVIASLLIAEAMSGVHSQTSLDDALSAYCSLTFDRVRGVDLNNLHSFFQVKMPRGRWRAKRIVDLELVQGVHYSRAPRGKVYVTPETAAVIAMSEDTPRANRLRRHFLDCEKLLESYPKKSMLSTLEILNRG